MTPEASRGLKAPTAYDPRYFHKFSLVFRGHLITKFPHADRWAFCLRWPTNSALNYLRNKIWVQKRKVITLQPFYGLSSATAIVKRVKFLPFSIFTVLQITQRRYRSSSGASILWENMAEFAFYID